MEEIWTAFTLGPFASEISSLGRIRGTTVPFRKLSLDAYGYQVFSYTEWLGGGKVKTHNSKVHRLVYEAFVGPIPVDHQINHKNGIRHDNRLENLEAVTAAENMRHSFQTLGRKVVVKDDRRGVKNGNARFSEADIREIRHLAKRASRSSIARQYETAETVINRIVMRKSWAHVK